MEVQRKLYGMKMNIWTNDWGNYLRVICALPIMLRYMLVVFLQGQDII